MLCIPVIGVAVMVDHAPVYIAYSMVHGQTCARPCKTAMVLLQAVERAITELTRLQKPLVNESEVAELSMGARSKEKVLEIIQTGTLRRNEMMADDEQLQVMQLVLLDLLKYTT